MPDANKSSGNDTVLNKKKLEILAVEKLKGYNNLILKKLWKKVMTELKNKTTEAKWWHTSNKSIKKISITLKTKYIRAQKSVKK
jgi:hypothetical protein